MIALEGRIVTASREPEDISFGGFDGEKMLIRVREDCCGWGWTRHCFAAILSKETIGVEEFI